MSTSVALASESESSTSFAHGHSSADTRGRKAPGRSARAVPDLPRDYPHPERYGRKTLWEAVLGHPIPRSTFVDWENSGRIPKPDKVVGRTKYWREFTVHATMSADKAVA
jgi:hypothetical protein